MIRTAEREVHATTEEAKKLAEALQQAGYISLVAAIDEAVSIVENGIKGAMVALWVDSP